MMAIKSESYKTQESAAFFWKRERNASHFKDLVLNFKEKGAGSTAEEGETWFA